MNAESILLLIGGVLTGGIGRLVRPAPSTETAEGGEQSKRDHVAWSVAGFREIFDTSAQRACGFYDRSLNPWQTGKPTR